MTWSREKKLKNMAGELEALVDGSERYQTAFMRDLVKELREAANDIGYLYDIGRAYQALSIDRRQESLYQKFDEVQKAILKNGSVTLTGAACSGCGGDHDIVLQRGGPSPSIFCERCHELDQRMGA